MDINANESAFKLLTGQVLTSAETLDLRTKMQAVQSVPTNGGVQPIVGIAMVTQTQLDALPAEVDGVIYFIDDEQP